MNDNITDAPQPADEPIFKLDEEIITPKNELKTPKPRSEKQLLALSRAREKRAKMVKDRKAQHEEDLREIAIQRLMKEERSVRAKVSSSRPKPIRKAKAPPRKPRKPKLPPVEESETESEYESYSSDEQEPPASNTDIFLPNFHFC